MMDLSSSKSGPPLAERLPVVSSPELLERTWRRVEATRRRRRRTRRIAAAVTPALVAALALWFWPSSHRVESPEASLSVASTVPAPSVGPVPTSVVHLSATSFFTLGADAGVTIASQTDRDVRLALDRGRVRFSVDPAERRQWTVSVSPDRLPGRRCDPVDVEVIGTVFDVERTGTSVMVAVDRGVVAVRGPGFRHRVAARQSVTVPLECGLADAPVVSEATPVAPGPAVETPAPPGPASAEHGPTVLASRPAAAPVEVAPKPVDPPAAPRPRLPKERPRLAAPAQTGPLTPPHGPEEAPSPSPTFAEVMTVADGHRRSGRLGEAIEVLEALLRERDHEPGAGIAAYTMATLHDELGAPKAAAQAFERAGRLGLPDALRAAATARAFDAWSRAGDAERATAGAADYLLRYPEGPVAGAARALLGR